jgi:hypothetical protein
MNYEKFRLFCLVYNLFKVAGVSPAWQFNNLLVVSRALVLQLVSSVRGRYVYQANLVALFIPAIILAAKTGSPLGNGRDLNPQPAGKLSASSPLQLPVRSAS